MVKRKSNVAVPTYLRLKTNDYTTVVVRFDDGNIDYDRTLMFELASTALNSEADNLSDAVDEMKTVIFEKYGKVKIAPRLIEAMEEFFIENNTPKRLDYTEPRHWTTGRLPKKVQEEYEEGRKEEMQQLRRDSWETFKK